jgi:hypothetical protein
MSRNPRRPIAPQRTYHKYPVAPDGRGASTADTRNVPHGKDPLAIDAGKPSTQPRHDKR